MSSQTFAIQYQVEVDGTLIPIPWGRDVFADDNIIIVLEEYNQKVWIYYGKKNGLVTKRKAYRQADSLRGHGTTIGKTIIGRNLTEIIEIDQRKIDRIPEVKEQWDRLQKLYDLPYSKFEGECVTLGGAGAPQPAPKPKPTPKVEARPEPVPEPEPEPAPTPTPAPAPEPEPEPAPAPASAPEPAPAPAVKEEIPIADEYAVENDIPAASPAPADVPAAEAEPATTPTAAAAVSTAPAGHEAFSTGVLEGVDFITKEDEKLASLLIAAVLRSFADIYISKKGNRFKIESLDSGICEFVIENGKMKFSKNSFEEIGEEMKRKIQKDFIDLSS